MADAAQRRSAARIGGLSLHAYGDSDALARQAREGFRERFRREARELLPNADDAAIEAKAEQLRRLFYTKLGRRSAAKRRKKAGG